MAAYERPGSELPEVVSLSEKTHLSWAGSAQVQQP